MFSRVGGGLVLIASAGLCSPFILVADVDECITGTPCLNGGTCDNTPAGSFTCNCTGTGYTGATCETGKYS